MKQGSEGSIGAVPVAAPAWCLVDTPSSDIPEGFSVALALNSVLNLSCPIHSVDPLGHSTHTVDILSEWVLVERVYVFISKSRGEQCDLRGLSTDPAVVCLVGELSPDQHNLSSPSVELALKESTVHSTAHVALPETAPGSQQGSSLRLLSPPSAATFVTAFFSPGDLTQSTTDHSVFVANSVAATSNEVVIDDDEMDNFLPEAQWTSSRVVSPLQYVTASPPGFPEETLDSAPTPSLPSVSPRDEAVTSAWPGTAQQPTACAEFPGRCSAFRSTLRTSEGMIPTPSRNLVLYPTDPYGRSSSRTLLEVVASGAGGIETLLFSSTSSVPEPLGDRVTQQPFPTSAEVSVPPKDVLVPGTGGYPDVTTVWSRSLKETMSPSTSPAAAASQAALAFRSSSLSVNPALFSTPLAFVSFPVPSADVSYDPVFPGSSREASQLPGSSVAPSHADDTPVWSPAPPLRPYTWCVSCTAVSPRHGPSTSLMEKDMGSGDGAETMTLSEASSISPPPSSVVADFSEFEEDPQEYNRLFPSRPMVPLSSRSVGTSETSTGLAAAVDVSSAVITHAYPSHGRPSLPLSLDTASSGSFSAIETQAMPSSVTAGFPSASPGVLLDSSFSVSANGNSPSLATRDPTLSPSYTLEPSVEASLFPDREPSSCSQHETRSHWEFASSFFSTPPLEAGRSALSPSEALAVPPLTSSDLSASISQASSTLVETLTLSDSLHLQPPWLSVPNSTNLDFSQLWPSSDLLLNASTFLPSYSEMPPLSGFSSESPKLSGASAVSLTDSEAHFTSALSETTSSFESPLTSYESAVATPVPSGSEPLLDVFTAGTHSTSLSTAFHTTPTLTESSLFSTPASSDGDISALGDHTSVLPSLSKVVPTTAVLVTAVSLPPASSFVSEVVPSPVPSLSVGPSLPRTESPMSTSRELSAPRTSAAPDHAADTVPNSVPQSQNPPESSTALPSAPLHPGPTSAPEAVVTTPAVVATRPPYVCDITVPDAYLITTVLARRAVQEYIITSIKEVLRIHFNRAVELKVYELFADFTFLVTSGPFVYTAISVINVLINSKLVRDQTPLILAVKPSFLVPESRFQVQTVLQFVPPSVDTGFCNFTQRIEKGLMIALSEVRKHQQGTYNLTVQILNITVGSPRAAPRRGPVNIVFAVRGAQGFWNGTQVSELLRNLSEVEFSFYLGYPVLQIAEPFQYPQLNLSQLLKSSWVRTVLLGVVEKQLQNEVFQAEMERKLAQLLSEVSTRRRVWRRATVAAGNSVVQVVNVSRLEGEDDPVQLIYFVEDQHGERLSAVKSSDLINKIDIQRAAIILGYRIQGAVAQRKC
ncbi:PREDICTED: UPF0606 protein KIAA1549-like, partial [Miniopterus natalensis]|uniref:UPF0606 protein KIAA1549-like n=1 Tax=Miniopterus natalensis TaxID=291302 RepID=UPI0007A6AD2A